MAAFDIVVLGGGPGGYVSAIRSAQLGNKTAIIDQNRLGGVCLNWGCIPTKALLKSAEILHYIKNSKQFGIQVPKYNIDFVQTVKRSRDISLNLSKGIEFLMKKNKIKHIVGRGILNSKSEIIVSNGKKEQKVQAKKIIIATGGRAKKFAEIEFDDKNIILSYLVGSVSGSMVLGKLKGIDIRTMGSGNAGGTNALRSVGPIFALGVILIDIFKGIIAVIFISKLVFISHIMVPDELVSILCGTAAVLGHVYPIYYNFQGGKGAGTLIGIVGTLFPQSIIYVFISWFIIIIFTGFVGLEQWLDPLSSL